jgi:hypothetical protein
VTRRYAHWGCLFDLPSKLGQRLYHRAFCYVAPRSEPHTLAFAIIRICLASQQARRSILLQRATKSADPFSRSVCRPP